MIDDRLRIIEKKMWTIAGALTIISFLVSPIGQKFIQRSLTTAPSTATLIEPTFNDTR